MKKLFLLALIALCCTVSAKELKVLSIGNSFSASAARTFPWVTGSVPGCRVILTNASIGGCSLERHWKEWSQAEKNPKYKPYGFCVIDSAKLPGKIKYNRGNVNELIKNNKYDIITIQQVSTQSWVKGSFYPELDKLIANLKNDHVAQKAKWEAEKMVREHGDEIARKIAEDMATNPELRALYDVQRDMDPEDLQRAIDETNRRREIQLEHNKKYGIIPQTIKKPIENNLLSLVESYRSFEDIVAEEMVDLGIDKKDLPKLISKLEKDMHKAAKILDFERASEIRDQLKNLREIAKEKNK